MKIHRDNNILIILMGFIVVSFIFIEQFDTCKNETKQKAIAVDESYTVNTSGIGQTLSSEKVSMSFLNASKDNGISESHSSTNTNRIDNSTKSDVVSDIGNNIGDGLQPLDTTSNLLVLDTTKDKSISLHHFITFIGLTFLITFIFLLSIYIKMEKPKPGSENEYKLIDENII
jgi:hypothetical protein